MVARHHADSTRKRVVNRFTAAKVHIIFRKGSHFQPIINIELLFYVENNTVYARKYVTLHHYLIRIKT